MFHFFKFFPFLVGFLVLVILVGLAIRRIDAKKREDFEKRDN